MEKVTADGVITIEESKTMKTELDMVEGMQFDRGYVSAYMVTDTDKMEAVLDDPFILITDKKISNIQEIMPLLNELVQGGGNLLIIAEDVDGEALSTLVLNKLRGALNVCAVKAPGFGDRRRAILEDIAALTGGQVISSQVGMDLKNASLNDCGRAKSIKIDKESTVIVEGNGKPADVEARKNQIKQEIELTTSEYDKEKLNERLAHLSGGVAVIKAGAPTEAEMKEAKYRIEDALNATKAAVEEGVIPGGGSSLILACKAVDELIATLSGDEKTGASIIRRAIEEPVRQIAFNAGFDGGVIVNHLLTDEKGRGYNALTNEYVDMFEAGIIDPTKVIRTALQNAASIAAMFLTTEACVAEILKEEPAMMPQGGGMGMM